MEQQHQLAAKPLERPLPHQYESPSLNAPSTVIDWEEAADKKLISMWGSASCQQPHQSRVQCRLDNTYFCGKTEEEESFTDFVATQQL